MCGRYVSPDTAAIERAWQIARSSGNPFLRRFNVAPTMSVPVLRGGSGALVLIEARWGFVPAWWKQPKPPSNCFNARSEEVAAKPMWRDAYSQARCLVPAEGWYEWSGADRIDTETGEVKSYRQPHFIFRPERRPLCFAGLMSLWKVDGQVPRITCAILTRAAGGALREIHERMPVVLPETSFAAWLDPALKAALDINRILESAEDGFAQHKVSPRLNSAKNDDEALIQAV